MDIKNNKIRSSLDSISTQDTSKAKGSSILSGPDQGLKPFEVNVSAQAKELSSAKEKAFQIAKDTPPIREKKIQELRDKIASGSYRVSSEDIAEKIVQDAILQNLGPSLGE